MLQTIYESEFCFSSDGLCGRRWLLAQHKMRNVNVSVESKPEVPMALETASPLDLRTDLRMLGWDTGLWEKQLQRELLLIQKQQQIQKQLLITEFQKQHENMTRQHQAQLQEHIKLQKELQAVKQQQEQLEKERKQNQEQERELERHHREQQILMLRHKERARESAMASTEVKQKLQEFLLSKSAKDPSSGVSHSLVHHPKFWHTAAHHASLEQNSPPLEAISPSYQYTPPSSLEGNDDFPLRKTASEPNLKVRSRLKQKVAERRSSPLLRRKHTAPYKKKTVEFIDSMSSGSASGTEPSSPNGGSTAPGAENGTSSSPAPKPAECWPTHQRVLKPEDSMTLISLYASSSLPNITLGLLASPSVINSVDGTTGQILSERLQPGNSEGKVNQALLQHLLLKEQMRQQKVLSGSRSVPILASKDRTAFGVLQKLPPHRPLNRTQSAPLPQSALAQLVIQQQHQHFLEKQKQYQQQVHINKMLSKSIEQLRQPSAKLQESEEDGSGEQPFQEDRLPPCGGLHGHSRVITGSAGEDTGAALGIVRIKEEPSDQEDDPQGGAAQHSAYLLQVKRKNCTQRMAVGAMI